MKIAEIFSLKRVCSETGSSDSERGSSDDFFREPKAS